MTLHDQLRPLDPVDRHEPPGDADALLRQILAAPVPIPRAHRRRPRVRLGVVGATGAAAAVALLALPHEEGGDLLASAFAAVSQPDTILHYTSVERATGEDAARALKMEVWQAADGSQQRVVTRAPGLGSSEEVVDGEHSRTFLADRNEIIAYDEKAPAPSGPGTAGAPEVGDPRTLLERAHDPGTTVVALGDGRIRDSDVERFRVGACRVHVERSGGAVAMTYRSPVVVAIAKDSALPVQVEQPSCRADGIDVPAGPTIDYVGLEVLKATAATEAELAMRPHPGATVRDGEDIDAAEARSERGRPSLTTVPQSALPTTTP